MTDTPLDARHDELTAILNDLGLSLNSPELREGWAVELRGLAQAQTHEELFERSGRVGGWATALYQAGIVGPDTHTALNVARITIYARAAERMKARP